MIEQSQHDIEAAMKADPAQWAYNWLRAMAVIEELENRLLQRMPSKKEIN